MGQIEELRLQFDRERQRHRIDNRELTDMRNKYDQLMDDNNHLRMQAMSSSANLNKELDNERNMSVEIRRITREKDLAEAETYELTREVEQIKRERDNTRQDM